MNNVLKTLEYDKITDKLSKKAHTFYGKNLCYSLLPKYNVEDINYLLDLTNLAESLVYKKSSPYFLKFNNIEDIIQKISLGSVASISELYNIKTLLANTKSLLNYISEENESVLKELFENLEALPNLNSKLHIINENDIEDNASENLFNIRKNIISANESLRNTLNDILIKNSAYLQDNVVTMRNNRYCIPVKNEYKQKIKGIVHDSSASGMTFFIEPIAVIEKNNAIETLKIQEEQEVFKILSELSSLVLAEKDIILNNLNYIAEIDLIFAKAELSIDMNAHRAKINTKNKINLKNARHPLIPADKIVPINLLLEKGIKQMIITGPNTGGKTVTLKTVGLLTLMTQSGLNIPCNEESEITIYDSIFADIGDEQSIEQNLSTFSSHMTKIIDILNNANSNSLVLFDELGSGTDPIEGSAIALSILKHLKNKNIMTIATTHYSEIKYYAHTVDGVINASCEFDIKTLQPTYKLIVGVAGKSNAFAIAKRLGLSDDIIDAAKLSISSNDNKLEETIMDLDNKKRELDDFEIKIQKKLNEADAILKRAIEKEQALEDKKLSIIEKAKLEAANILASSKKLANETIRELQKNNSGIKELEKKRSKIRDNISKLDIGKTLISKSNSDKLDISKLKIGDSVHINSYNTDGIITALPDAKGNVFVSVGVMSFKVKTSDLSNAKDNSKAETKTSTSYKPKSNMYIKSEIKLLGYYGDDAIAELDKYIDDAVISGLNSVRIVHGKGSGQLRKVIHNYLKKHPSVESFNLAEYGQGDAGVTIAVLK